MRFVISSCTAMMSSAEASTRSLQMISPLLTSSSCAFTRKRSPTRIKPADRTASTLNSRPTSARIGGLALVLRHHRRRPHDQRANPRQLSNHRIRQSEFIKARRRIVVEVLERQYGETLLLAIRRSWSSIASGASVSGREVNCGEAGRASLRRRSTFAASASRARPELEPPRCFGAAASVHRTSAAGNLLQNFAQLVAQLFDFLITIARLFLHGAIEDLLQARRRRARVASRPAASADRRSPRDAHRSCSCRETARCR